MATPYQCILLSIYPGLLGLDLFANSTNGNQFINHRLSPGSNLRLGSNPIKMLVNSATVCINHYVRPYFRLRSVRLSLTVINFAPRSKIQDIMSDILFSMLEIIYRKYLPFYNSLSLSLAPFLSFL